MLVTWAKTSRCSPHSSRSTPDSPLRAYHALIKRVSMFTHRVAGMPCACDANSTREDVEALSKAGERGPCIGRIWEHRYGHVT
eukprot:scaffold7020_cov430-Prasinococcus_capsulatus_cf.AAC.7